nr:hypothetical protein Iba_chr07fCG1600 [Ipomoea batatas]
MRNNSTNDVSTKVEVLKLRQVPNLWRDVETSEAGKRSKIEVVKSTREISIRRASASVVVDAIVSHAKKQGIARKMSAA